MPHFPITASVEEALKQARESRRDDMGYLYHTFRIRLPDTAPDWHALLSRFIDEGWQLQGTPVTIEEAGSNPRHVIFSMLHAEPHPLQIRGELRIRGEIVGGGDLRAGSGS